MCVIMCVKKACSARKIRINQEEYEEEANRSNIDDDNDDQERSDENKNDNNNHEVDYEEVHNILHKYKESKEDENTNVHKENIKNNDGENDEVFIFEHETQPDWLAELEYEYLSKAEEKKYMQSLRSKK